MDGVGNLFVADGNSRIAKFRSTAAVPEPGLIASFLFAGAAGVGVSVFRKRRK